MDIVTDSNKNGKRVDFSPMENLSPSNPISTTAIGAAKTLHCSHLLFPPWLSLYVWSLPNSIMSSTHILRTKNILSRTQITFLIQHTSNSNSEPAQGSWSIMVTNLRPGWNKLNNILLCFNYNYVTLLFHSLTWKLPLQQLPLLHFIVKQ